MTTNSQPGRSRAGQRPSARRAAQRAARRRRLALRCGIATIAVAAAAGAAVLAANAGGPSRVSQAAPAKVLTAAARALATTPPWAAPADAAARMTAAGLLELTSEGTAAHYHAHLDILIDGRAVTVPADIGIDNQAQRISAVHTHDPSGVIHVESPTAATPYYLGEFFTEWDVALTSSQIGALHADGTNTLTAYVNGHRNTGDTAAIKLANHQEIALIYGPIGKTKSVPSTYNFAARGL